MKVERRALYKSAAWAASAGLLPAAAEGQAKPQAAAPDMPARIASLLPDLERMVKEGMAAFDIPGAAVGIVAEDRLVYAKGFGLARKGGHAPAGTKTVFQIGSTTKAFLATMLALAVDRKKLRWEDRVVDLDPAFALKSPYVTRAFRVYDLMAQRSGLPPYANDGLSSLGFDAAWLMRSLRFVDPVTSFRSTFSYTNITHLFAGRIVTKALAAFDWPVLARTEILAPLGMRDTSFTAEAIEKAPDHAVGHRFTLNGSVAVPFDPSFPYLLGPAGDINSTIEDCALWLRMQIAGGVFAGRRLVSEENLRVTRTPKVALSDVTTYAMGWVITDTPNGRVIWHNGGTAGFGAHIGFLPAKKVGLIVLSNEENVGFPDAVAFSAYDRLLANPETANPKTDYMKAALGRARSALEENAAPYRKPASPRPPPDLAGLAGAYASDALGPAMIAAANGGLVLTLRETGASLRLEPFDGALFTTRLVPEGRFVPMVAMLGDDPLGFADFQADADGKLTELRWMTEGQTFRLRKS